ncbi:MAG: DUF305 domain-containing protein [Acaryochloridaceae cyanobacterium RU_4_10]|nr:DUF305 domain-containing protein [Acaryochloridaceae cyanobacterium RU_4_10]
MNKKVLIYSFQTLLASGAIAGLLAASTVQAQSPKTEQDPHHPSAQTAPPQPKRMMAQIDRHFIEMMIPHHQGAIEMADLALIRAKRPEIKKLAEAIKADQTREIQQMRTWYKQWYGKEVPASPMGMGMMNRGQGMGQKTSPGMMGQGQGMMKMHRDMMGMEMNLDVLKNASDFDREFIRQMIPHHQMAVMMARMVQNSATRPEILTLGQSIMSSQTAEIDRMRQWYQAWYP